MEIMEINGKKICVCGYHNEDFITEIDLTKLDGKDIIKFEKGDLYLKQGSKLIISQGSYKYIYTIDIKDDGNGFPQKKQIDRDSYYVLKSGSKYNLTTSPDKKHIETKLDITSGEALNIPWSTKMWGGGGLNLAITLRALSPKYKTKIHYFDVMFETSLEKRLAHLETKWNDSQDYSTFKSELLKVMSDCSYEECIEFFLKKNDIEYNFFEIGNGTNEIIRANLVLSKITDGINTIGDRIILKSPVQKKLAKNVLDAKELKNQIGKSFENTDTLVLNTVKHYEIFKTILNAYYNQKDKNKPNGISKFILLLTEDNRKWFNKFLQDPKTKIKQGERYPSMYCIWNEKEFENFMKEPESTSVRDAKFLFPDGSPNFQKLVNLSIRFREHSIAANPGRMYITLGKHGSVGIDGQNQVVYVKTYPTRGINIFDTTGCGDAWAGSIVLLEHHRTKNKGNEAYQHMSRFMRIASGTAWTKMTSPTGIVRIHEVIGLLDSDYIPWTIVGTAIDAPVLHKSKINDNGSCKRIKHAGSIDCEDYKDIFYD